MVLLRGRRELAAHSRRRQARINGPASPFGGYWGCTL